MQRPRSPLARLLKLIIWPVTAFMEWRRNERLLKNLQRASFKMQIDRIGFRRRVFEYIHRKNRIVRKPMYHNDRLVKEKFKKEAEELNIRNIGVDPAGNIIVK